MPRARRQLFDGLIYHVLNRGNDKKLIFADAIDYFKFFELIQESVERHPLIILAYCLMPNHFHLVLQAPVAAELGQNMHWLLTTHARRFRTKYEGAGHVWQGRFKSFPVQSDHHLITLLRYVEGNPVRAGLAGSCVDWRWSSAIERLGMDAPVRLLSPSPVDLPPDWLSFVDNPLFDSELAAIHLGVQKQTPFGDSFWQRDAAGWDQEKDAPKRGRPPAHQQ